MPRDPAGERILKHTLTSLAACNGAVPSRDVFSRFANKRYSTQDPQAASAGLLPVTLQAVENSYSGGLRAISIGGTRQRPELFYEEQNQLHHLICGTKEPVRQDLYWHGNVFKAAVQARFTHDEDENPAMRIQIDLLETPCTRVLKLILTRRCVIVKQEEYPGLEFLTNSMGMLLKTPNSKTLMAAVLGSAEQGYLRWKLRRVFSPELRFEEDQ